MRLSGILALLCLRVQARNENVTHTPFTLQAAAGFPAPLARAAGVGVFSLVSYFYYRDYNGAPPRIFGNWHPMLAPVVFLCHTKGCCATLTAELTQPGPLTQPGGWADRSVKQKEHDPRIKNALSSLELPGLRRTKLADKKREQRTQEGPTRKNKILGKTA